MILLFSNKHQLLAHSLLIFLFWLCRLCNVLPGYLPCSGNTLTQTSICLFPLASIQALLPVMVIMSALPLTIKSGPPLFQNCIFLLTLGIPVPHQPPLGWILAFKEQLLLIILTMSVLISSRFLIAVLKGMASGLQGTQSNDKFFNFYFWLLIKQCFFVLVIFDHAPWHAGSKFPDQGSNPPLHWKPKILTSRLPGKSYVLW